MRQRSRTRSYLLPLLVLGLASALVAFSAGDAAAQRRIQRPGSHAHTPAKVTAAKQARAQRVGPAKVRAMAEAIDTRAASLGDGAFRDAQVRSDLSTAPLRTRLNVFSKAAARRGHKVQTFDRRVRGMVKNGKLNRVVTTKKTFFEVTPETLDLLPQVMGENVIWFAAAPSPGHLHTLVADQDGGGGFHHNTYGEGPLEDAAINAEQYIAPAQLTAPEMDRFVRYLNAGVEHTTSDYGSHAPTVYGFRSSSGALVCNTACTNWATSAPVGDLKRWVRTVDRKVASAARAGRLPAKFQDGLHAELAKAESPEARAVLIQEALSSAGMTAHTKSLVKRLGKEFNLVTTKWPNRPRDLIGRQSLSEVMGVARSQDPAKWMYDLMTSKRVPVVGVLNRVTEPNFDQKVFNLEIMGQIGVDGEVVAGGSQGLGAIPAERRLGAAPQATPTTATSPAAGSN